MNALFIQVIVVVLALSQRAPDVALGVGILQGDRPPGHVMLGGPIVVRISLANRAIEDAATAYYSKEVRRVSESKEPREQPPVLPYTPDPALAVVVRGEEEAWIDRTEVCLVRLRADGSEEVVLPASEMRSRCFSLWGGAGDRFLREVPYVGRVHLTPDDSRAWSEGEYLLRARYRLPSPDGGDVFVDAAYAFNARHPATRAEHCAVALETAGFQKSRGDEEAAMKTLQATLTAYPDWGAGHYKLGSLKADAGDDLGAVAAFEAYLGIVGPKHPRTRHVLARLELLGRSAGTAHGFESDGRE